MTKFVPLAALACALSIATGSVAMAEETMPTEGVEFSKNDQLYTSDGKRIGKIYRVTNDGNAQVIYNNRLLTIEASTLSIVEGKLTTSLTRADLKGR
ncbi:MAG: hypothetical protein R3E09_15510 [Novosphingobium sp.]|nr:hypothetical protein [Novosphingobium sp.]